MGLDQPFDVGPVEIAAFAIRRPGRAANPGLTHLTMPLFVNTASAAGMLAYDPIAQARFCSRASVDM